mmetsp:Transcript_14034/g.25342  ORF Transcript_14034/g.25342 Transcript_14034/m.25342 type:complete len:269 (+) Transcript_14034:2482-3288(+)
MVDDHAGDGDLLLDFVFEIPLPYLAVLVEHGEAGARDESRALGKALVGGLSSEVVVALLVGNVELVGPHRFEEKEDAVLLAVGVVVDERPRLLVDSGVSPEDLRRDFASGLGTEAVFDDVVVVEVVHFLVRRAAVVCGAFPFEFEDHHSGVVARSDEVEGRVHGEDPVAVIFPTVDLGRGLLVHVPHADALVFRVGNDEVFLRVEQNARNVVYVSAHGVDLPGLVVVHTPQFHLAVISSRGDVRHRWVEGCPVYSAAVALEHMLHSYV